MAARGVPPTTGAVIAAESAHLAALTQTPRHYDLGICPHCQHADGVERYMIDEDTPTSARYCSHCETRWRGKREAKARAA